MSEFAEYNRLLLEVKMKALEVLQRLLTTAEDPKEKRRIAEAILKASRTAGNRVVITPPHAGHTNQPTPRRYPPPTLSPHALGTLHLDTRELDIAPGEPSLSTFTGPLRAAPLSLAPSDAAASRGGPAGRRPLPFPLGPQLA